MWPIPVRWDLLAQNPETREKLPVSVLGWRASPSS